MTADAIRGTARIYQFPKGGRAGLSSGRHEATSAGVAASTRGVWVDCGGASYHEDGIRQEAHTRHS